VHHIAWWDRDGGATSIDNAIALCSFHHHEVHRHDLQITRRPLVPPRHGLVHAPPGSAPRDSSPDAPSGTVGEASRGSRRRGSTRAADPTGPASRVFDPTGPASRVFDPTGPATRVLDPTGPSRQRYAFRRPDGRLVAPLATERRGVP